MKYMIYLNMILLNMEDDIYDIIWNKYHNNLCHDMKRYLSQKYVYIKIYIYKYIYTNIYNIFLS